MSLLATSPTVRVVEDPGGAAVVKVASEAHRILGAGADQVRALLALSRGGIPQADLIEFGSLHGDRLSVLKTVRALIAAGALTVGASRPAAEAASPPTLTAFELIPRHCGTWEGDWLVFDAAGNLTQRFEGTLVSEIIENQWVNELQQRLPDGSVEHQRFVGEVLGPRLLRLRSTTPQMSGFELLLREVAHAYLLVELSDKTTGSLRAIELVALVSPETRTRTMQSFADDGSFQGAMTIVERLRGRS